MQKMDIEWTIVGPFTDIENQESKWVLPENKTLSINHNFKIFIFLFFICLFLVLVKITTNLQNEYLNPYSKFTSYKIQHLIPNILDKNNNILIENKKLFDLYINTKYVHKNSIDFLLNTLRTKYPNHFVLKNKKSNKRQKILENLSLNQKIELEEIFFNLKDINLFKNYNSNGYLFKYGPEFVLQDNRNIRKLSENGKYFQPYLGFYNGNKPINGFEKWYHSYNDTKYLDINTPFKKKKVNSNKLKEKINLSVDINLIKNISIKLKKYNEKFGSEKIITGIIDSKSGKILSIATSNYWENGIEINNTKNDFVNFMYEPGSIMKPISYLSSLENNIVKPNDLIDIEDGKTYIGRHRITDDHFEKQFLTAEEVIIHSSNVGISKIVSNLPGESLIETYNKVLLFKKPYLELPFIKKTIFNNKIKKSILMDSKIYKATTSYGYGFMVSPLSIISMYNIIANDCKYSLPTLLNYEEKVKNIHLFSEYSCKKIKSTLKKVVDKGTGINTKVPGLKVGGKTGTTHIVEENKYKNRFNATFVGYVEDDFGNTFTTFTVVHKPDWIYHYASQSAAVINKVLIQELLNLNYLKIKL